jgi:diguanylate cyclase (GGDEF)-like protein
LIQKSVRNASDLVGRFGKEEFIVVIEDIAAQKATDIANNILTSIEQTTVKLSDEKEFKLTATIGICSLSSDQIFSVEQFVDLADKALYDGKNRGGNRVVIARAT